MDKPKKKKDPDAPIRPWASVTTWVMLNLIWMALSPMATPHPVLSEDGGHREYYEMEVPSVLGADLPFEVSCSFSTTYTQYQGISVSWELWEVSAKEGYEAMGSETSEGDSAYYPTRKWSGGLNEDCGDSGGTIYPGKYVLEIRFISENDTRLAWEESARIIDGDFSMQYWIYAPHQVAGYVIANLIGIIVLVTDQAVRRLRRRVRLAKRLPLHRQRHKEEWESLKETMEDSGSAAVESFQIKLGATSEAEREAMRSQFADSEDEDESPTIPEEQTLQPEDDLGEGTVAGLEGKTKVDKDIKTVGDLWKRMEDEDL